MNFNKFHSEEAVALIIVIFAMMLFAVLGWTLANLQSGDFEINLRNLDSERALGLAEAGTQWALNQLSQNSAWRTTVGAPDACDSATDWLSTPHSLSPGQYNLCCRNPVAGIESGNAVIEARGFVPQANNNACADNCRAMRQVKLEVSLGSLTNAVMTQPADPDVPNKGLFNWWPARQNHTIQVEGNIYAGHYDGDGVAPPDESGQDYNPPPASLLPQDSVAPSDDIRDFSASFPSIDMQWFYNNASSVWPSTPATALTAQITTVVNDGVNPGYIEVSTAGFFTNMANQAVRLDGDGWYTNDANWRVISQVVSGTRARLDQTVTWPINSLVKLMRRFYQNTSGSGNGINYIGGQIAGGTDADTLIDLRNGNVRLTDLYLICEGDIVIKGTQELQIRFTGGSGDPRYPTLATKNGDIISTDIPQGANDAQRVQRRQITGLIYSEFGHINLNYLEPMQTGSAWFRGNLVYGYRITLDGQIDITYLPALVTSNNGSFAFAPGTFEWREQ